MSYSDGDVINRYVALRAERKQIEERHKAELEPTLKAMETIENYILGRLNETNAQSIKSADGAIAYKSTTMSVRTDDSTLLMNYVRDTNQFGLLTAAVAKDALKDLMDANGGHPPPGVSVAFITKVNFRKG
jgi:hypothetical protein